MPDAATFITRLQDQSPEQTSHGNTQKWVLKRNIQLNNALTQIAVGHFQPGESCPEHQHESMFEYFYFTKGCGTYQVGTKSIVLEPNTLVEIPPKTDHQLFADKGEQLEFLYWGVSID